MIKEFLEKHAGPVALFLFTVIAISGLIVVVNTQKKWWPLATQWPRGQFPQLYISPLNRRVGLFVYPPGVYHEFTRYGIRFKVPWSDIPTVIENPKAGVTQFRFNQDQRITVMAPSEAELLEVLAGREPLIARDIRSAFGKKILETSYDLYNLALESRPDQVTILTPRLKARTRSVLIGFKQSLLLGPAQDGMFRFDNGKVRGFQFGIPLTGKPVYFHIFGKDDKKRVFIVYGASNEEIDFILASMKTE